MDEETLKQMSKEEIKLCDEAFRRFDKDGNGKIKTKKLELVMESLGHNPTKEEMSEIIEEIDKGKNGVIEFPQFCALMKQRMLKTGVGIILLPLPEVTPCEKIKEKVKDVLS